MAIAALGTTSYLLDVFISDSSSTTGAGLPGLAYNTASLTAYYHRSGDATATQINLVTMTLGTFTSSGFVVVDGTNMPGWYQLGVPNAALAAGTGTSIILKGAANMAPVNVRIDLTAATPDVNVASWKGTTVPSPNVAGYPLVDVEKWHGTAQTGTGPTSSGRPGQR